MVDGNLTMSIPYYIELYVALKTRFYGDGCVLYNAPIYFIFIALYLVLVTCLYGKIGHWLNGSSNDILTVEPPPLSYPLILGFLTQLVRLILKRATVRILELS